MARIHELLLILFKLDAFSLLFIMATAADRPVSLPTARLLVAAWIGLVGGDPGIRQR
jgi:hypothetical protein